VKIPRADFERLTEEALARLPARFRDLLYNVQIETRSFPRAEAGKWNGDPALLGLYTGLTREQMRSTSSGSYLPARIILYQRNIERVCESEERLRAQIEDTLRHEIAHHLGFDESQVRKAMRPRASRRSAR
jgi:predicted Zn-dependent protease with MMP-like domain